MSKPRGRVVKLSPARRLMCDMMEASLRVPLVAIERRFQIGPLLTARRRCPNRPSWFAILARGFGLVAAVHPELRRAYLSFPVARYYEAPHSVAIVPVERKIDGEDVLLFAPLHRPESRSIADMTADLRHYQTAPIEQITMFRRGLRYAGLPRPMRRLLWWIGLEVNGPIRLEQFGTFGVTGLPGTDASSLRMQSVLPANVTLTAFEPDGSCLARLTYDHRVLDGLLPARALGQLEECLHGPILSELNRLATDAQAA